MKLTTPLAALLLATAGLFAIHNAIGYALLASLIATVGYLLVLAIVPRSKP